MKTTERNKIQRELTILQAKKRSGIGFTAADAERLSVLEDQMGTRKLSLPRTHEIPSDEPPVIELSVEDELPEAELVDASTLFDAVRDTEPDLPVLSPDATSPPRQRPAADDVFNDAFSLDTPDQPSAEKEGQELLQSLFDTSQTGSLDIRGVLIKATLPPLKTTTTNAETPSEEPPPAPVALGKVRVVSRPTNAEPSTESALREPPPLPGVQFKGPRKAIVHFLDGVCRRGTIKQPDVSSDIIHLDPQSNEKTPTEELPVDRLKAIFLLLPRGAAYPQKIGKPITVLLVDGRKLMGTSQDYNSSGKAFTLLPAEDKGNVERVIVFRQGAKQIVCSE